MIHLRRWLLRRKFRTVPSLNCKPSGRQNRQSKMRITNLFSTQSLPRPLEWRKPACSFTSENTQTVKARSLHMSHRMKTYPFREVKLLDMFTKARIHIWFRWFSRLPRAQTNQNMSKTEVKDSFNLLLLQLKPKKTSIVAK